MSKIIICRCEDVTLEDLKAAYAAGFRDLESLKRYTGLCTGFCQGKGCLTHAARLLAHLRGGDDMVSDPVRTRPLWQPTPISCFAEAAAEEKER